MASQQKNTVNSIAVISFYSFVNITELDILQAKVLLIAKKKYIRGTIIISKEGFNGSISGNEDQLKFLLNELIKLTSATDVNVKVNYCFLQPFSKIKVKVKEEIVALKIGKLDVTTLKGKYIDPHNWDEFISREDVILVDTRNEYEIKAGTFKGAIDSGTQTFRQFPKWVQQNAELLKGKKIAMCCTGGIRCEKSTAYMKSLGYEEVYHLKGGILQYIEDTHNKRGLWKGECFVFDDRGAVSIDLSPSEGYWVTKGHTAKSVSINK